MWQCEDDDNDDADDGDLMNGFVSYSCFAEGGGMAVILTASWALMFW